MSVKLFKEQFVEHKKLLLWILLNGLLCAMCWAHVYTIPLFASNNTRLKIPLNVTLHDLLHSDTKTISESDTEDTFNGLVWVKLVFFIGFACSQFSIGFLADIFGPYKILKIVIKMLILSGVAATLSENIYFFCAMWFIVAFTCTSSFLLMISQVIEQLDTKTQSWKWRLIVGSIFQISWIIGRYSSNLIVYICDDWVSVMLVITIILIFILFAMKKQIWNQEFTTRQKYPDSFKALRKSGNHTYMNILLLSMTWFVLGFNYYGNMNNFDKHVSDHNKTFQHIFLQTLLALLAKIMALIICFVVRRKCLPMAFIQVMLAVTYFILLAYEPDNIDTSDSNSIYAPKNIILLLTHLTTFLVSASFELIWILTPETFPTKFRNTCTGICSTSARIGAITGILLGEMKILNLSHVLLAFTGTLILISGFLIKLLPDMTKHKLPENSEDVLKVQFPSSNQILPKTSNATELTEMT